MRKLTMTLCALSLSAGMGACAHDRGDKSQANQVSPEQQATDQRKDAAQGTQAAIQQFEQNKKDYMTKAGDDINRLEAQIAAFKAQPPANPADRPNHDATVQSLEQNLAQSRAKLNELKDVQAEDWSAKQRDVEQSILMTRAAYDASAGHMAH